MLKGINLTLLIGPGVPVPVPQSVLDSLQSVQVNHGSEGNGFDLSFTVSKDSLLTNTLLPAGYFDPIITRVMIIVTLNGMPNLIMDGFVTQQEVAPSNEVGQSTLSIKGKDISVAMDLVKVTIPYPAMTDTIKALIILARYAWLGVIPLVIPSPIPVTKSPTNSWDCQTDHTDLEYLNALAARAGYIFNIIPGPLPGQSIAYLGPDANLPIPQPALSIDMDAHTNVESLNFSLNVEQKEVKVFTVYDPITKKIPILIPVPNVDIFKPPLGIRPTPPAKLSFAKDSTKRSLAEASRDILAHLMSGSNAVSASGSLDVLRYGHILRSRMLVGVRGASLAYDGLYYVDSVSHNIKAGEYKQNFSLSRDGLISNTPRVLL